MGPRPDGMRSIPERKRSFRHQLRLGWLRPPGHCSARRRPSFGKRTGITPIRRWDAEGRRSHHRRPASGSFTEIRMMPKGPGSDRRKARVPCCLRRTMLIVRLTHPGNRMDRDDSGRPGARGIHAGFRPRHRPHPEVSGRLSTAQRRTPPRSCEQSTFGWLLPGRIRTRRRPSGPPDGADFLFLQFRPHSCQS